MKRHNGYRERSKERRFGALVLKIPKLRSGSSTSGQLLVGDPRKSLGTGTGDPLMGVRDDEADTTEPDVPTVAREGGFGDQDGVRAGEPGGCATAVA